jgi:hypothetical protein
MSAIRLSLPALGERARDAASLLSLSLRTVAGRRYWIAPLLPLLWIVFQIVRLLVGWRPEDYTPADAQTLLIGFPVVILAVGLGGWVIAGEIERRTLEIAYTVPGGAHQVWLSKLGAAMLLVVSSELLLAIVAYVFCTEFPPVATLYGVLQSATFFLVLSMAMSALFKSEAAGALVTAMCLGGSWVFQQGHTRVSPFFNPLVFTNDDPSNVLAWTVQNRIGIALAILALVLLAFGRAENREKLLGG